MSKFSDMLIFLRKRSKLSQQELADRLGMTRSAISMYETAKREPDLETFEIFADYFNVDMNTLTGKSCNTFSSVPGLLPLPSNKAYPLLGDIACGTPILAEQNITEYIQFPDDLKADFCLRCKGDSMIDAHINDGDIVFIREQPEVLSGQIAAVLIDGEATLKRVYYSENTLTLMAANAAYPPRVLTGEQLTEARIIGLAVNYLSTVK